MPPADFDAGVVCRNERHGDPEVLAAAQDVFRIEGAECEADERRIRSERDVALIPRQAEADDVAVLGARHDADVAHGGGVRARSGPGEREAGDLIAAREAGQVVAFLALGAVFLDELAWAERVRHHDDRDDVGRARGDLADDQRLRLRGETKAAVLL